MAAITPKSDEERHREALERVAERGGLPKLADLQEIRRLAEELATILDEYAIDARIVGASLSEYEENVPFPVGVEDIAVLALTVEEVRNLNSELEAHATAISKQIVDVDLVRRLQAGELH